MALILSRKLDERIVIDLRPFGLGVITVAIADIRAETVRLAIAADSRVAVDREEIHLARERDRTDGNGDRHA